MRTNPNGFGQCSPIGVRGGVGNGEWRARVENALQRTKLDEGQAHPGHRQKGFTVAIPVRADNARLRAFDERDVGGIVWDAPHVIKNARNHLVEIERAVEQRRRVAERFGK